MARLNNHKEMVTMTTKQEKFIRNLLAERVAPENSARAIAELDAGRVDVARASRWIEALLGLPKIKAATWTVSEPEAGMYVRDVDGAIIRVYLGQKSGRMLAKRVVKKANGYGYEYLGAAAYHARNSRRMPLAEAKEWGRMTGHCCVCARRLDVPESVDAGIGPVCAGRVGA